MSYYIDKVIKNGEEYNIKDSYDKDGKLQVVDGVIKMTDKSYQCATITGNTHIYIHEGMLNRRTTLMLSCQSDTDVEVTFSGDNYEEVSLTGTIKAGSDNLFEIFSIDNGATVLSVMNGFSEDEEQTETTEEGTV